MSNCLWFFNGFEGLCGRLLGALGEPKAVQKSVLFSVRFFVCGGNATPGGREVGGRSHLVKTATDPPGATPLSREKKDKTTQGSHNDPMIAWSHDHMIVWHGMTERALRGLPQSESSCSELFERSEFKGLETEGGTTGHADLTRPWGGYFDWPVQHFLTFGAQGPFQERLKHVLIFQSIFKRFWYHFGSQKGSKWH